MTMDLSKILRKHLTIKARLCLMIFLPLLMYIGVTTALFIHNKNRLAEEKIHEMHTHVRSTLTAVAKLSLQLGTDSWIKPTADSMLKSTLIVDLCILDHDNQIFYSEGNSEGNDVDCDRAEYGIDLYRDLIDEGENNYYPPIEFDDSPSVVGKTKIGSIKYGLNMAPFNENLMSELISEMVFLVIFVMGCIPFFVLIYQSVMNPTRAIIKTINRQGEGKSGQLSLKKQAYADELEYAHAALIASYENIVSKNDQLQLNTLALKKKTQALEQQISVTVREKDKADKANASKSEFLSMVSHEVRGPIANVFGLMEVLSKSALSSQDRMIVQLAFDAMEPLLRLLEDLMHFSTLDYQQFTIYQSYCDLIDEFSTSVAFFVKKENNDDIDIALLIRNKAFFEQYLIETDRLRIRQVLHNLISNAIKFTKKGTIQVTLDISQDAKSIHFSVKDSGIGIDQSKQQIIFNKFEQLHDHVSTRKYGGIGIGLTICKRICVLMNGSIDVKSEVGKGSCFSVQIPIQYQARPTMPTHPLEPAIIDNDFSFQAFDIRVLILEDNLIMNTVLSSLLKGVGIIVEHATSAEEAIDLFKRNTYAIAVIDCYMPVISGFDVARSIRDYETLNDGPQVSIIGVSASINPKTKELAIESGMDFFLTKPYKIAQLYALIQNITTTRNQIQSALSVEFTQ